MNAPTSRLLSRRTPIHASVSSTWTHALIWLLITVAALLLVGFTAVAEEITQRGELRRTQQGVSGSLMLPDELITIDVNVKR